MKRVRQVGALVCAVILCVVVVSGQESPSALETAPPQPVPAERASPRATMTSFLEAFYEIPPDLDAATGCLDLEGIPREVRAVKGRELAVKLKDVLDRTILIDVVKISDATDGEPYVVLKVADGEIAIDRDANGEWLFTLESLASLTTLWEAVRDRPVLAGVEATAPTAVSPGTWLQSNMPESLRGEFMYLELWQWFGILLIVIVGVVCGRIFSAITARVVERFLNKHETTADHEASVRAVEPLAAVVMVLVWGLGVFLLGLPMSVFTLYYRVIKVVAVAAVVFSAYRFADVLSDVLQRRARRTKTHYDDMLVPLVRKSIKVFVVTAGLLTVAQVLGTNLTALFASVGIGGLALALAAQDTVSNFFGSLMVILDRPFQVGDWIKTGDVEGTVEEVGFRSTRVRTFYNSLITLPNANLIKASVDNLGSRTYRRWVTRLGVAYDTPPEKLDAFCEGIRELVRKHPYTRKDYFHIYFNEFGRDALEVLVYVFFFTPDWGTELRERHRLGVDIIRLALEIDVEFAFPTQTLHLRSEDWIGQAAAGDEYPAASTDMQKRARGIADRLVDEAVGGEVPPPVQFDRPPQQDGGSE